MALEGPHVIYARREDEPALTRALRLAREVEELLDEKAGAAGPRQHEAGAHSSRIARAMAAGLVDELQALLRGTRKSGLS